MCVAGLVRGVARAGDRTRALVCGGELRDTRVRAHVAVRQHLPAQQTRQGAPTVLLQRHLPARAAFAQRRCVNSAIWQSAGLGGEDDTLTQPPGPTTPARAELVVADTSRLTERVAVDPRRRRAGNAEGPPVVQSVEIMRLSGECRLSHQVSTVAWMDSHGRWKRFKPPPMRPAYAISS